MEVPQSFLPGLVSFLPGSADTCSKPASAIAHAGRLSGHLMIPGFPQARPGQFPSRIVEGRMLVSQFLWLWLALFREGWGPAPRFSDRHVSASLHSGSGSWSSVWGISTAWAGRLGAGPLEISTWVSAGLQLRGSGAPGTTLGTRRRKDARIPGSEIGTWFWSCGGMF